MPGRSQPSFDVYGLLFSVAGDWPEVVDSICRDFAWFETPTVHRAELDVRVQIRQGRPDLDVFGPVRAAQVTEQQVVYRLDGRTVIDHLGVVCSVIDRGGAELCVVGEDPHVARRIAYDFLLARAGDHLDRVGLPRVYGLGLGGPDGAVLIMLPRGGGKTTLALRALREPAITFFSEVSPLVDRRASMHPFPFPLWVRTNSPEAESLPDEHLRRIGGAVTDPRLFELDGFRARIARESQPLRHLVIGERSLGSDSRLEPASTGTALMPLLRVSVASFSMSDAIRFGARRAAAGRDAPRNHQSGASGAALRVSPLHRLAVRTRSCSAALRGASVWRLTLGRDREAAWQALAPLFR